MRRKTSFLRPRADAFDRIRKFDLCTGGRAGLRIPDWLRPYAFQIAATGASPKAIKTIMQLTCEAKFGEDGKEGAEHGYVPRAKWWQSLTQLQLPTFMETIAALQIGAAKRGLCISWDKGEIQKRRGGCINIHVRIERVRVRRRTPVPGTYRLKRV